VQEAPRVPDRTRRKVVAAVQAGERKSVIARRFGISHTSVLRIARAAGLADPVLTEGKKRAIMAATEANSVRAKYERSRLALEFLRDARKLRRQVWQPHAVFAFGGKEFGYVERQLAEPPAKDKRDLVIAAAVSVDKGLALIRFDRDDDGQSTVKAAIITLVDALTVQVADEEAEQIAEPA
jgi:hypothetical protein